MSLLSVALTLKSRVLFAASFETLRQVSRKPEMEGTAIAHCRVDQGKVSLRPHLQVVGKQLPFQNYLEKATVGLRPPGQRIWFQAFSPTSGSTQNSEEVSCLKKHTSKVCFICHVSTGTRVFSNFTLFIL